LLLYKERQRKIASYGGKCAHAYGKAHEWDEEEASIAGKKGGAKTRETYQRRKIEKALQKMRESA